MLENSPKLFLETTKPSTIQTDGSSLSPSNTGSPGNPTSSPKKDPSGINFIFWKFKHFSKQLYGLYHFLERNVLYCTLHFVSMLCKTDCY